MNSTPLVSIIVPIYNVEPYLRRCLDSVINQTYTNLEIILVDDGSLDNSPTICDEYAKKDHRIVVIHKQNEGLSEARNTGLNICKGEYISFVDSDDWIAKNFIEVLLNHLQKENAELAICHYIKTKNNIPITISTNHIQCSSLSPVEATKKLWTKDATTFVTAWGKLYKATLWENLRFPKGVIFEDEYTSYKLLYNSQKTILLDLPLYFYFQRFDSITTREHVSSTRALKAHWDRFEYFKSERQTSLVNLCLETLCWDLLFAYSQAKQKNVLPLGFNSSEDILEKLKTAVECTRQYNSKFYLQLILKLFVKIPSLYLFYRNYFPVHIRDI